MIYSVFLSKLLCITAHFKMLVIVDDTTEKFNLFQQKRLVLFAFSMLPSLASSLYFAEVLCLPVVVAQWYKTCLAIRRLRVQVQIN
jgi:hypothetical protein